MHPLAERAARTIRRHRLIPEGARLLAALSGGSDSVALTLLLADLQLAVGFTLAGLAHFNHRLRFEAADRDERFCRDLAARLKLSIDVETADVRVMASTLRVSIEEAARHARYQFFHRAIARSGADRMALGHTRDDQAETLLLRLIRGAGPGGLAGMHPQVGPFVRPLLDITRDELQTFLQERDASFCDDASNFDVSIPRNRIRHELLPLLATRFSSGIVEALARVASIQRDDAEALDAATSRAAGLIVTATADGVEIDRAGLLAEPQAIAHRLARLALQQVANGRFIGFDQIERLLDLAVADTPKGGVDFPGCRGERRAGKLVLRSKEGRKSGANRLAANFFRYSLSIPGEVAVPQAELVISAERRTLGAGDGPEFRRTLTARGREAAIDAANLPPVLSIRNRRPGDDFIPLGLKGRKKLQDFFVDRKVPRQVRERVPLVVDDHDRIVWVAGHGVADEFRVTERTQTVVILRLKDFGGQE